MAKAPLDFFPRMLGEGWDSLPEVVRRCHHVETELHARGHFAITRGKSWLARFVCHIMRMPPAGSSVLTRLDVRRVDGELLWLRDFDGVRLDTRMYSLGGDRMAERRGMLEVCFRMAVVDRGIEYRSDGARLCIGALRIALPSALAPRIDGRAWAEPGDRVMRVRIQIASRILGTILSYQGPLELLA